MMKAYLLLGSRLTLIKHVLGGLGVYYFYTFKALKKIIDKLESIRRNFFWGGSLDIKEISWIPWDKALSPLSQGGLAICSHKVSNQSMLIKWWVMASPQRLDNWVGGGPLNVSYPRLFHLEVNKNFLVRDRAPTLIQHPIVFTSVSSLSDADSSFSGVDSNLLGVATGPIYLSGANSSILGGATATGPILPPGLHFE
ncbi:hypothetical protein Tco_0907697 [Tanacetum coccineum]|uniref:Uncharacterized protein n=1 Tax=Tanacetum coccineum TaxID=301880 RepID=A0ABQ5CMU8_9ASTR